MYLIINLMLQFGLHILLHHKCRLKRTEIQCYPSVVHHPEQFQGEHTVA